MSSQLRFPGNCPFGRFLVTALLITAPVFAGTPQERFFFEPNRGQFDGVTLFRGYGSAYQVAVEWDAIVFRSGGDVLRLSFPGMSKARFAPEGELESVSHHYETRKPVTFVPHYTKLRMSGVYPGIDLVLYSNGGELEFDFVVSPVADSSVIRMRFSGVKAALSGEGSLVFPFAGGEFRQALPRVFQRGAGGERDLHASFHIDSDGDVRFAIADREPSAELIVDPTVSYAARVTGTYNGLGVRLAVDPSGNMFVGGAETNSSFSGSTVFVRKFSTTGVLQWLATFPTDMPSARVSLATDSAGNLYVGSTAKTFNTTPGAFGTAANGGTDVLVVKLPPEGSPVVYATLIGGSGDENLNQIAVDSVGNVFGTGSTKSGNFPVTTGTFKATLGGVQDAFVFKLNASGSGLVYATFLGGTTTTLGLSGSDDGRSIAIDNAGNAYVAVNLESSGAFVSEEGAIRTNLYGADAYLVKLNPAGSAALYATYVTGISGAAAQASAVDELGRYQVGLMTLNNNLITTSNALRTTRGTGYDGFVSRLNSTGSAYTMSTYVGVLAENRINQLKVGPGGLIHIVGTTGLDIFQPPLSEFLTVLNPNGESLAYTSQLIISASGNDLQTDKDGNAYVTGNGDSTNFVPTAGASTDGKATLQRISGFATPCPVTVSPAALTFSAAGGSDRLSVTSTCQNFAIASATWIRITSGTARSGNGGFDFTVSPNTGLQPRAGAIEVGGSLIQILQQGTSAAAPFNDVPSSNIYVEFVRMIQRKGITVGCNATDYCPDSPVTRGQMAVFIVRAMMGGDNFPVPSQPYFEDVPSTHPLFKWIQVMKQFGITSGCTATKYCPDDSLTRGQMAAFIVRARLGGVFSSPAQAFFDDVTSSHPFFSFVQEMRQDAITTGCTATSYCPDNTVTRGQMAVFIARGFLAAW